MNLGLDPDAPWWVNVLLVLVVLGGIPALTTWLTTRPTRRTLHKVAADAQAAAIQSEAAAIQTNNSHADAEYPNLREELTATRKGFEEFRDRIREDIGGLRSEVRDLRRDVVGMRTDARRDRRELTEVSNRLDKHLEEVPQIVADATRKAIADHTANPAT